MTQEHAGARAGTHVQPLLEGALRERAIEVVLEVAQALRSPAEVAAYTLEARGRHQPDATLSGGSAGIALLYAYLACAERAGVTELAAARIGEEDHTDVAMRHLDAAIEAMATRPMGAGLFSGFPGIAWAVTHVDDLLRAHTASPAADEPAAGPDGAPHDGDASAGDAGADDAGAEIDWALLDLVSMQPWQHDYDLISGLAGMGVYALERLRHPAARDCLLAILDRLDENGERQAGGVTWHTAPDLLPPHQRAQCPGGYYNLGLAHGVPGVIGLLAGIWGAGLARERVGPLLEQSVGWLLAHRLPPGRGASFAWVHAPEVKPEPTRAAWCYGDPGVAAALLLAGQATGNPSFTAAARDLAVGVATRPKADAGVIDAGLCHGSAGLAQVLLRLYWGTGEPVLAEAARMWLAATLNMHDRAAGPNLAGFRAYNADSEGRLDWRADPCFLTGVAGVALALLAGLSPVSPDWDRMLMLSLPPPANASRAGTGGRPS